MPLHLYRSPFTLGVVCFVLSVVLYFEISRFDIFYYTEFPVLGCSTPAHLRLDQLLTHDDELFNSSD